LFAGKANRRQHSMQVCEPHAADTDGIEAAATVKMGFVQLNRH